MDSLNSNFQSLSVSLTSQLSDFMAQFLCQNQSFRQPRLGPDAGESRPDQTAGESRISRIRRNLFIHKARIPARRFSSSTSQHFKMFPAFASNEGYSASGLRYQSDGVRVTHPLPHSEFTRIRERLCDLTLTLSHSPFAYYSYISSYSLLIIPSAVL